MKEADARVRFELASRPENVALVRTGLAALAEVFEFGDSLLTDLKTAVSEACNNVVIHAYPDAPGPMSVTIECSREMVDVNVSDHGTGIRRLSAADDRMGLGLGVMSALADRIEFLTPTGGGAEVRMCFRRSQDELDTFPGYAEEAVATATLPLSGDSVIWFEPVSLMKPVLGRIFRAVAASSHFTVDRFADLYAVTDALADYAEYASDGDAIGIAMTGARRRLNLVGGPFPSPEHAHAAEPAELQARREALAGMVDGLTMAEMDGHTTLELLLVDETRAS